VPAEYSAILYSSARHLPRQKGEAEEAEKEALSGHACGHPTERGRSVKRIAIQSVTMEA